MNNKVLLHICCACCATSVIEQLRNSGYDVIGYFYNPNIHPEDEFVKRQACLEQVEKEYSVAIIREEYRPEEFYQSTKGHEQDKEGGERCKKCFHLRLRKTYQFAKEQGIPFFTSTLSVSAYKDFTAIEKIGKSLDPDMFLAVDFKKQDGYKKSVEASKKLNLYRQKYCGCAFSTAEKRIDNRK